MSRKDGKSEDLKNMLMSFRIAELQTLLGACGRSRSGRKHELMGRALNLLKSSDSTALKERVKTKILELYHQRFPPHVAAPYPANPQPYVNYNTEKDEEPTYLNRPSSYIPPAPQIRSVAYPSSHIPLPPEPRLQAIYEPTHSIQPAAASMPIHPDVRFIKLPFFNVVDVLIKPTSLVQKTLAGFQDMNLVYHLTPYQTQLITNSRSFNVKAVIEYGVQVQLRFCLAETSCVQEDLYPSKCKIFINGKNVTLPGQPPPNAQNQEPRKPHRPINITPFCRLSPMQSNNIAIQWVPSELGQRFTATVHLVRTVQANELIQQLRQRPERSPEHTLSFIKEKLRKDPDSEIALTSLKVSLCCPIGRTRMAMPCRTNNCSHLQCFDGSLYVQLNEKKPSWLCPVCDQKAHFDQLFIDGLFVQISKKCLDCDDIVFFEDGSWRPLTDIQDNSSLSQIVNTPRRSQNPERAEAKSTSLIAVAKKRSEILDRGIDVLDGHSPRTRSSPAALGAVNASPPPMPVLERAPQVPMMPPARPGIVGDAPRGSAPDEAAEVIIIDDSDSEEGAARGDSSRPSDLCRRVTSRDDIAYPLDGFGSSSFPFNDPDLQGLDLYNLLPHEDRIAAAMYLDQAGLLNQLTNPSSRSLPTSVIEIRDE